MFVSQNYKCYCLLHTQILLNQRYVCMSYVVMYSQYYDSNINSSHRWYVCLDHVHTLFDFVVIKLQGCKLTSDGRRMTPTELPHSNSQLMCETE